MYKYTFNEIGRTSLFFIIDIINSFESINIVRESQIYDSTLVDSEFDDTGL